MFKSRYAMFMFAPNTGVDGGAGAGINGADSTNDGNGEVDYKALYEQSKALFEKEKQEKLKFKEAFDKKASELSAKEKAERERMTDEEKRQAENAEKEQRYQEAMARVAEMETATLFAENGFDKKDYDGVAKKIVEVGGDRAKELAETLIAFVKKANASAVANARNGAIKDGAVPPKTSTAKSEEHTYAQMATQSNQPSNREQEIKDFYKKK